MIRSRDSFTYVWLAIFVVGCDAPDGSEAGQASGSGGFGGWFGGASGVGGVTVNGSGAPGVTVSGGAGSLGGSSGVTSSAGTAGFGGVPSGTGGASVAGSAGAGGAGAVIGSGPSYYVSPTGSDGNAGTVDAPFQTLTKARDTVRTVNANMADDIHVYLRGGTYRITSTLTFGTQDSGTNGHRIFYEAYPGEVPVLNGATQVTGWSQASGNVYKAPLSRTTKLRNLYVNDARASMTSKTVNAAGGYGTYAVTAGQASWAWVSGSSSDGVKYGTFDVPNISNNKDDLEIVNRTTWNENIVCVRDVVTTPDNYRALLLQQPYGAIAQLPGWGAAFSTSGSHTIYNAFEFLNAPGEFYFDKSTGTLFYYPKAGEDMATADVEAPVVEKLVDIAGMSNSSRVRNLTFQGITFTNTDYALQAVADSRGKSSVQAATVFVAYGDGNYHSSKYRIIDTLPGIINVSSADGIRFTGNVVKHGGSEGIAMVNDVVNSDITGNFITDVSGSGITIGHPQHVYLGDGGDHEKYPPGVEGICTNDSISNNVVLDVSMQPGFGGHAGITAFFVDTLSITHNQVQTTAYNGINLGWGWRNFPDSTTCKNNTVNFNRMFDTLRRLHDSGAIYTIGQMPGTNIDQNYVKGIPPATTGPTYGLHNDEGSAYITENDNVLDIDPNVKYTINCEDYGAKHDLTIVRTYATVNKMGINPPNSVIDPPVVVPDNVWPLTQYTACVNAGVEDSYKAIIPSGLYKDPDYVFPASCAVSAGASSSITIRSLGSASSTIWFAPSGTSQFAEGPNMTKASGSATSIAAPASAGTYKLFVVDAQGTTLGESAAILRVK